MCMRDRQPAVTAMSDTRDTTGRACEPLVTIEQACPGVLSWLFDGIIGAAENSLLERPPPGYEAPPSTPCPLDEYDVVRAAQQQFAEGDDESKLKVDTALVKKCTERDNGFASVGMGTPRAARPQLGSAKSIPLPEFLSRRIPKPDMTRGSTPVRVSINSPNSTRNAEASQSVSGGRRVVNSYYCGYCFNNERTLRRQLKKNGEDVVLLEKPQDDPSGEWWDHVTKAGKPECRVVCPKLRAVRCRECGETGDNAHTPRYCPLAYERQQRLLRHRL